MVDWSLGRAIYASCCTKTLSVADSARAFTSESVVVLAALGSLFTWATGADWGFKGSSAETGFGAAAAAAAEAEAWVVALAAGGADTGVLVAVVLALTGSDFVVTCLATGLVVSAGFWTGATYLAGGDAGAWAATGFNGTCAGDFGSACLIGAFAASYVVVGLIGAYTGYVVCLAGAYDGAAGLTGTATGAAIGAETGAVIGAAFVTVADFSSTLNGTALLSTLTSGFFSSFTGSTYPATFSLLSSAFFSISFCDSLAF